MMTRTKKRIGLAGLAGVLVVLLAVLLCWLLSERDLDRAQQDALKELEEHEGEYDPQTIVLNNTSKREAEALAAKFGATLRITQDGSFATLTLPGNVTISDIYAARSNRKLIASLSVDYEARISDTTAEVPLYREPQAPSYSVSDPLYDRQGYLNYLNLGNAWSSYRGQSMTVAVIDTGIDTDHPEFSGRISEYSYNATEDKIVKDNENDWSLIEDTQGHGTAVAGALAAAMDGQGTVGIAPQVTVLVIKAECTADGTFLRTSDLVFGLYYAIERDVAVVNMSFGVQAPVNPFAAATRLGKDSDILMVAAAGNDGSAALCYPAADENVIGVGALAEDSWELAGYSNYGENVNVVAPGTVFTAALGGEYGTQTGTSLASPLVAAAMTLLKSTSRYAENATLIEILYAACYDLGDLGADWYFGYGAVDVSAMLFESRGKVTFHMMTDELENTEQLFIRNHTLQDIPEPERLYAVFDGWYYDVDCTEPYQLYADRFVEDLTLYAAWVNEDDGVPFTYVTLEDGTVEIRSYTGHRRYVTIPDTIDGKQVSSIGDRAFLGESNLRQIYLPKYLKSIGLSAFSGCSNLTEMEIPSGVTKIEAYAFQSNVRLSAVVFASDSCLAEVGDFAFAECSSLKRIDLPATLTRINGSAFYGATSLTAIQVAKANSVYLSSDGVLFNRTGSTLIAYPAGIGGDYTVPATVRSIGSYAFACTRAGQIGLGQVTTVGDFAFAYSRVTSVAIPDTVISLGGSAYAYCAALSKVTLGNGLTVIPMEAFAYTSSLSAIEIPANTTWIKGGAFCMSGLRTVTFAESGSLRLIGDEAFAYCPLTEIVLPASLVQIGDGAFLGTCLSLVTFAEDSSLQSIGSEAFAYTASLTAVTLPNSLRMLGSYTFLSSGLTGTVTLPASLTNLGAGAFAACHSLTALRVADGSTAYADDGVAVYTKAGDCIVAYPAGAPAVTYTVADGVTAIGTASFYGAAHLQAVTLPEGVTELRAYAFYECTGMTSYALPQTLTTVGEYALAWNSALTGITLPDQVVQIGRFAFAYDWQLYTITLRDSSSLARIGYAAFALTGIRSFRVPANVSTVAQYAFDGCPNLTSVTFAQNSKLESISAYLFLGCESLQRVTFESGSHLTSIQAHGFEGMANLSMLDLGDAALTEIDNYAFRYCSALQALNLPQTLTNIGRFAFYKCTALRDLSLPASVEHIGSYAFYGTENCNVYFASEQLPLYLDESWDNGLTGYYTGVITVKTDGDWKYAVQTNGMIAIIQYSGTETAIDLTALPYGTVETVGGYAFYNKHLTSVVLPDTLVQIQRYAFADNRALAAVEIPERVNYIAQYAFYNTGIQSLTFAGNALQVMEQYAFAYTQKLTTVTIPSALTKMGSYAFYKSGVQSVTFAEGCQLTEIPKAAFAESELLSVTIPDSVTLVRSSAFRACTSLEQVTLGAGQDLMLESNAFYKTGLTALEIPANVRYIGEYCFVGLEQLQAFAVSAENPYYSVRDGVLFNKAGNKLIAFPAGRTGSYTVPQAVEVIGFGAFENSKLERVAFADGINLLTLGYRAFYNAKALTRIDLPASVVSIDYYAFAQCTNLAQVTFAEGNRLTGIYEGAFYGCQNLVDITLPDSIVEISDYAFYGCMSLDRIPVSETSGLKGIYSYAFAYTGIDGEMTTLATLQDIGAYAFSGTKITGLTVSDANVENLVIGIGAWQGCDALTYLDLPFSGASYGDTERYWFAYIFGAGAPEASGSYVPAGLVTVKVVYTASSSDDEQNYLKIDTWEKVFNDSLQASKETLTTVVLPEGLRDVGYYSTFENYKRLTNVIIQDGVTSIGSDTFHLCSSLTSITIPSGVTSIGSSAFSGCSSLTNITIPDSVTSIGTSAFYGCSSLTNITIPDGVVSIGKLTFFNCGMLMRITIPDGLISIDDSAFTFCYGLYEVINLSALPLTIGSGEYGGITQYAKVLIDANGNKTYRDGEFCYLDTADGFRFALENGTYTLLAYLGTETTVTLPKDVNGASYQISQFKSGSIRHLILPDGMTSISSNAFSGCSSLTSITIPDSVTSIGDYAFRDCSSLTNITIPDGVTSIAYGAFFGCSSLTNITIPDSVTSIGSNAFYWCSSLTSITIPDSVTSIGVWVFSDCSSLMNITISDSVMYIGGEAFVNCKQLTAITLPKQLQTLGEGVFANSGIQTIIVPQGNDRFVWTNGMLFNADYSEMYYLASNLSHVTLPTTLTTIPRGLFHGKTNLKSVVIPDSVTSIGVDAFSGCSSLANITIPDGVTSIGGFAFSGCSSLTSITIPDGVTSIGDYAFRDCSSLTNITIPDGVTSIVYGAFFGCSSLTNITIPDSVTSIGVDAFSGCSSLTNVTIPDGVTCIAYGAFFGCSSLTSITIPDGVTSIGDVAFYGCSSLTSITIPNGVTSIGDSAFYYCSSLMSITISDSVTSIGDAAFCGCSSLTSITIPDGVTSIGSSAFSACSSLTSITIPDSVKIIGSCAFNGCNSLTSITIPDSVKHIESGAFQMCSCLYEVINLSALPLTIGSSEYGGITQYAKVLIDASGNKTYYNEAICYLNTVDGFRFALENGTYTLLAYLGTEATVTLPKDVNGASYQISQFKSGSIRHLILPDGMTSISGSAFWGCSSLTSITIPNSVMSIGWSAFSNCSSLTSITIPDSVTSISGSAFWGCSSLTSITIPNSVTSIGGSAFRGCSSLTSITIPDSVTSIGDWAFYACSSLTSITIPDSVTFIDGAAFRYTAYYNDPNNWVDGCLWIGKHLIEVRDTVTTLDLSGVKCIANSALNGAYHLTYVTIGGNHSNVLNSLTNLVTLTLTELPTAHLVYEYFGYGTSSVPITLKNIVLQSGCDVRTASLLSGITGVTVYVEAERADCPWDNDLPGWSNDNRVVYGDGWFQATFMDFDGNVISSEFYLAGQVIRPPHLSLPEAAEYRYSLVGWDLDGDGIADSLPANVLTSITARAVIQKEAASYRVEFIGADGTTVLYRYDLSYLATLPTPQAPQRKGYTFLGWSGLPADGIVSQDLRIYSLWKHEGEGHTYTANEVAPTCTEQGYTLHTCTACGESYKTDLTAALGHDFGDWVVDRQETCTADGLRHRICGACSYEEQETVPAHGHAYAGTVTLEPTCSASGEMTYACTECGDTVCETLEPTEHTYEKRYASKTWLQWLIERLLNIFFGFEGDRGYYFVCSSCGHIQTIEESASVYSSGVQGTACDHCLGEWDEIKAPNCTSAGVSARVCEKCHKAVEAAALPTNGTHTPGEWLLDAAGDYRYRECVDCHVEVDRQWLCEEKLTFGGHSCSFHNNLTLNYYADAVLQTQYQDVYVVVEKDVYDKNGNKTVETATLYGTLCELDGKQYLRFTFTGIAAAQLGSEVRARLYAEKDGAACNGPLDRYDLKTYAYNRLAASDNAAFKTLMVDLLNYCAAAQLHFEIRTDELVNAELTAEQRALASTAERLNDIASLADIDSPKASFCGNSVLFNHTVVLKSYFRLDGVTDRSQVTLQIRVTDTDGGVQTYVIPFAEFVCNNDGIYSAKLDRLNAAQFRSRLELTLCDGDTAISGTYTYSIESYAARRLQDSTSETFRSVLTEMMKYSSAVNLYLKDGDQ